MSPSPFADDGRDDDGNGDGEDWTEVEQEFEGTHAAFHAHYHFNCATPSALDRIEFHYFSAFPGAEEVEVTMVGASGQKSYEVERDAPLLRLR